MSDSASSSIKDNNAVPRPIDPSALGLPFAQSLFADSPLAKSIEDHSGRLLLVNDAFVYLTGLNNARVIGLQASQIPGLSLQVAAENGPIPRERSAAIPIINPPRLVHTLQTDDGRSIHLERISEPWISADGAAHSVSLWLDISARIQAEVLAQARRERTFGLFDQIPVGLALTDARGALVRVNAAMRAITGTALERFLSRPVASEATSSLTAPARESSAGQSASREALVLDDGRTVWLDRRTGSLPVAEGIVATQITAAIDVTREVALETERASQAANQYQVHIREMHHRIKNNLQGIAGLIQHNGFRWPHAASMLNTLSEQVYAVAEIYGLQCSERGILSLQEAVKAIARNLGRVHDRPIVVSGQNNEMLERWSLAPNDALSAALVLNELMTNALKHGVGDAVCKVNLSADERGCVVQICNAGVLLPAAVAKNAAADLTGVGLVRAMLPDRGDELSFASEHGTVTVTLRLRPPMVRRG